MSLEIGKRVVFRSLCVVWEHAVDVCVQLLCRNREPPLREDSGVCRRRLRLGGLVEAAAHVPPSDTQL